MLRCARHARVRDRSVDLVTTVGPAGIGAMRKAVPAVSHPDAKAGPAGSRGRSATEWGARSPGHTVGGEGGPGGGGLGVSLSAAGGWWVRLYNCPPAVGTAVEEGLAEWGVPVRRCGVEEMWAGERIGVLWTPGKPDWGYDIATRPHYRAWRYGRVMDRWRYGVEVSGLKFKIVRRRIVPKKKPAADLEDQSDC